MKKKFTQRRKWTKASPITSRHLGQPQLATYQFFKLTFFSLIPFRFLILSHSDFLILSQILIFCPSFSPFSLLIFTNSETVCMPYWKASLICTNVFHYIYRWCCSGSKPIQTVRFSLLISFVFMVLCLCLGFSFLWVFSIFFFVVISFPQVFFKVLCFWFCS